MKFNLKLLHAAILIAGFSPIASQAVVLPIIADSHLAATNAGASVAVNINARTKGLLSFDASTLPSGFASSEIAKATLVFYVKTLPTVGKLQVSPLTAGWTEKTVTTKNAPVPGLPLATSATISNKNSYFAVDVTDLVKNWIDVPGTNYGLALEPYKATSTSLSIDSKEATQTSHPAYIEIALKGSAAGEKGAAGATGAAGVAGPQGVPGAAGLNGETGADGIQGIQGLQGEAGAPGTSAPVHAIADSYGGGTVFYVYDGGQHGLIAATVNQHSSVRWYGGSNTNTRARADGLGAGKANTAIIIANQGAVDGAAFAATVCNEYSVTMAGVTYGDWYLPSKYELNLLYAQKTVVGGFPIGNIQYWSSTEGNGTQAWLQNFSHGGQGLTDKSFSVYVRAIRAF